MSNSFQSNKKLLKLYLSYLHEEVEFNTNLHGFEVTGVLRRWLKNGGKEAEQTIEKLRKDCCDGSSINTKKIKKIVAAVASKAANANSSRKHEFNDAYGAFTDYIDEHSVNPLVKMASFPFCITGAAFLTSISFGKKVTTLSPKDLAYIKIDDNTKKAANNTKKTGNNTQKSGKNTKKSGTKN